MNLLFLVLAVLRPTGPCGEASLLTVTSPPLELLVGEKVVLTTFGSRPDQPLRFEWRVVSAPADSTQHVEAPSGTTFERTSDCQHVYPDGNVPTFTPDRPGRYELELTAIDVATGESARTTKRIDASDPWQVPSRTEGGCATAPVLALGALIAWWRRRSR